MRNPDFNEDAKEFKTFSLIMILIAVSLITLKLIAGAAQ